MTLSIDTPTGELTLAQLIDRMNVLGVDDHGKRAAGYWLGILRDRLLASERQQRHLEEENRRLALDLYRATARAPFVTTEPEKP